MEKRVTCPNCQNAMHVNIWSETLTQVLKCSDCNKKFTYDPSKVSPEPDSDTPSLEPEDPRDPGQESTPPTEDTSIPPSPPQESTTSPSLPPPLPESTTTPLPPPLPDPTTTPPTPSRSPDDPAQSPSSQPPIPRETSKYVSCPRCTKIFQAGLPDNDKQVLTTQCPECANIFSFDRSAPPAMVKPAPLMGSDVPAPPMPDGSGEQPFDQGAESPDQPSPSPIPEDDEDFAIPLALKEKLERERAEQDEAFGSPGEFTFPEEESQRDLASDEGPALPELAPEPSRKKGPRGRLLSVVCPYCSESFGTPAPKTKRKVGCPICEQDFVINAHGEYIAKKALGNFTGGLAKIVGVEAMQNYQDTVRDSLEGATMLRDSRDLHHHMRSYSGKAGFLLMVVAILGILFSGSLLLSIPNSGEDDPSGFILLTGNVKSGLDLLEDAQVNITDSGRETRTNSEGEFQFEYVIAGDHTIEITASGKGKLIVHFTIGSKETKQGMRDLSGLVLPEEGTRTEDLREDRVERAGLVLGLQAVFIFVISLLALMGGLLAIQGKRFHATLFLSAISFVSIGFFIGMVMAILATVLVMLGKKEFIS